MVEAAQSMYETSQRRNGNEGAGSRRGDATAAALACGRRKCRRCAAAIGVRRAAQVGRWIPACGTHRTHAAGDGLVHEAYLRLAGVDVAWEDRVHFLALAARAMRRVLVDHARAGRRVKRGGDAVRVTFDEALLVSAEPSTDLVELDGALDRLAAYDERKAKVIELHATSGCGSPPASCERRVAASSSSASAAS